MLNVFVDRTGKILFTYPDVDMRTGDKVDNDGKIYLVVQRTFVVKCGWYEVLLHQSAE